MEIDGKNTQTSVNQYVKQVEGPQRAESNGQDKAAPRPQADTVALSDEAKALQRMEKALKDVPDVREEKVAAIRAQLAQGTYRVDSEKIAANMLKESVFNEKA
jgi:negative regulator of flagellin synthesis FlgM